MSSEPTSIVCIGAGSFATVYVCHGYNNLALKRVAGPGHGAELRKEFNDLRLLHRIVELAQPECGFKVPRPDAFFSSDAESKLALCITQPELEDAALDSLALHTMERVWPVPRALAARIRQLFVPEQHRGNEQLFVARLYLGMELRAALQLFNPLNFPLVAHRLQQLQPPLGVDYGLIAWRMGRCLARIRFSARRDTWDVEFVLGGRYVRTPAYSASTSTRCGRGRPPSSWRTAQSPTTRTSHGRTATTGSTSPLSTCPVHWLSAICFRWEDECWSCSSNDGRPQPRIASD